MADAPAADRRMSDSEGVMWRLEKDPYLTSNFATVSVLDRPPDFDRLRARMERAAAAIPRLRWRSWEWARWDEHRGYFLPKRARL